MKKIILVLIITLSSPIFAQIEVGAGMGLNFFSAPDLQEYFNSTTGTEEIASFNTSADFFVEIGCEFFSNLQFAIEYNFNIYSANASIIEVELNNHQPSLLAYYYLKGNGYKLKFGGGLGLRYSQFNEKIHSYGTNESYSTSGFGLLAKIQADTKLSEKFYALIAGVIRYDMPGEITTIGLAKTSINLNSFGIALKLGTVYYF